MTAAATTLAPDEIPLFLEALLAPRRAILGDLTLSLGLADVGRGWSVDVKAQPMVREGWSPDSELLVMSNRHTASEWLMGRFDPESLAPEHLFLWSGDDQRWAFLAKALKGGGSPLATRAAASKSKPKKTARTPKNGR